MARTDQPLLVPIPSPMSDTLPDAGPPLPGAPATLAEAYDRAVGLSSASGWERVRTPVARAFRDYLEALRTGLAEEADEAGWCVYEAPTIDANPWSDDASPSAPPPPYLLVPAVSADGFVALRGIPLTATGLGSPRKPHDAASRIEPASGDPDITDLPTPYEAGVFDEEFVWVARDPVDVLLLRAVGIHAVSLGAPSDTLGSAEGLLDLVRLKALKRRGRPHGTIVVVDPVTPLGDERAGLLCGLFEEVWEALPADRPPENGEVLTGAYIAREVRLGTEHGWDLERMQAVLMGAVSHLGLRREVPPVPLPPERHGDGTGGWAPRKPLALVAAAELAAQGDTTPWLVKPFVAARAITDLHGPAKAGKTTLLLGLAGALAQGTEFLGEPCKRPHPVVYVTEQTEGTIQKSAERAGGLVSGVHFLTLEATFGRPFGEVVAFVRRECRRLGAKLVVLDTLGSIAGLFGESDNMAGTARDVYRQLRGLSVDGVAVVVVRHSRKARGGIAETAAGSVAFSGEADQLVRFTKPSETSELRRVEVVGRIGDSETFNVDMTSKGWVRVEAGGDEEGIASGRSSRQKTKVARSVVVKVLAHVGREGATARKVFELTQEVGGLALALGTVRNTLKELVDDGEVTKLLPDAGTRDSRYVAKVYSFTPSP